MVMETASPLPWIFSLLGNLHLPAYSIIKDMLKNTGEQPEEDIHSVTEDGVTSLGTVARVGES